MNALARTSAAPYVRSLIGAALALVVTGCGAAPGSPLNPAGELRSWFSEIPWEVSFSDGESPERRQAVCAAAETWNTLAELDLFSCDVHIAPQAPATTAKLSEFEDDGFNAVAFLPTWAHTKKELTIPAYTTLQVRRGALRQADIYFNALRYLWMDRSEPNLPSGGVGVWDTYSVALHELGHWIFGPEHISKEVDPGSVMQTYMTEDVVRAQPTAGDIHRLMSRIDEQEL